MRSRREAQVIVERLGRVHRELEEIMGAILALDRPRNRASETWRKRNAILTEAAAQTWAYLFNEEFPHDRLTVRWATQLKQAEGQADIGGMFSKGRITLDWSRMVGGHVEHPLGVLIHEYIHARGYGLHNATFYRVLNKALRRIGLPDEAPLN